MTYSNDGHKQGGRRRPSGKARRSSRMMPGVTVLEERRLLSVFDRSALLAPGQDQTVSPSIDLSRLSDNLVDLYAMEVRGLALPPTEGIAPVLSPLVRDAEGRVGVDISASDVAALEAALEPFGFQITAALPDRHLIEGFIPAGELLDVTALWTQGLLGISGIYRPKTSTGAVTSEADFTLQAARARGTIPPNVNGAGVTIGVISDSYNNLNGAAAGIASGDLPASLVFTRDLASGGTDEGRGMMELVHDIAPGSPKAFATAFGGEAAFARNIRDLARTVASGGAGARVIVDDVFYFAEPVFQDGIIAQAVDDVAINSGVAYFSSAGNQADQAFELLNPTFATATIPGIPGSARYLQFSAGVFTQSVTLSGQSFQPGLQWSDPFYTVNGVKSNLDIFILSGGVVISSSTVNNLITQVPFEFAGVAGTGTIQIVIRATGGVDPTRLRYENFGSDVAVQFGTNSPTISPHSAAVNAMSVAASPFFDQKTVEGFSSKGPSTILFSPAGASIATTVRAKPDILATDGVSTTFFGGPVFQAGQFLFFGTSAAAPNAAAVAALVRQANPAFTPAQVYARLKSTADPNVVGGVNLVGAGLIDAYRAVVGLPVAATLPLSDGFETGVLARPWDHWSNGDAKTGVATTNGPAAGSNHLVLDSLVTSGFAIPGLGEATLHVNLAGQTGVQLSFAAKRFASETITAMPASFAGHNNSDGVAFSVDGANWFRLNSLSTVTTSYQTFNADLGAAAAAAGVTLSADTQIKFQRFSTVSGFAPTVGLAFDSVSVTSAVAAASVTSAVANSTYGAGAVIDVSVAFSAPVTVAGTPLLALNTTGGPAAVASYLSGSGTSTLVFRYIVAAGQSSPDLDYASVAALTLNGGSIVDGASNPAVLTLTTPGSAGSLGANKNIVIDAVAPVVTNITSTNADGLYGIGANITITIGLSKPVNVTGTPTLQLNTIGGPAGVATYVSGTGTSTLTFTYTVAAGQRSPDLDSASAAALAGTIADTVANNPNALLATAPIGAAAGSLATNKAIVIDAVAPVVSEFRVLFGTRSFNVVGSTRFDLPWQITGIQAVFTKPIAAGSLASLTGLINTSFSGLNTNTLTWGISALNQGSFSAALLGTTGDALRDAAGNSLTNGVNFNQSFKVLLGDFDDDGTVNSADMVGIAAAVGGNDIFADIDGDGLVTLNDVRAARKRAGTFLP